MADFHLETTAGALAAAMKMANLVRPKRATIPILTAVLLADRRLVATCLDMEISVPFAAARMEGRLVLDGGALGLLRLLDPDAEIALEGAASGALLRFPGGSYDLPSYAADDFPLLSGLGEDTEQVNGNAATGLPKALAGVRHAISTEETRYYLNGVALDAFGGEPCVVATDGHRLAWQGSHVPFPDSWRGIIVPTWAVNAIIKLGQCDGLTVGFAERAKRPSKGAPAETERHANWLRVEAAGVKLTTRLIDGTYPDWTRVVPEALGGAASRDGIASGPPRKLALPVAETMKALRRLRAAQPGQFGVTYVTLMPEPGGSVALCCRMDRELAVEVLPLAESAAGIAEGERLQARIGVNPVLLLDMLAQAVGDEVVLTVASSERVERTADSLTPAPIEGPFGFADDRGGHVMMPTRTAIEKDGDVQARLQALMPGETGRAA